MAHQRTPSTPSWLAISSPPFPSLFVLVHDVVHFTGKIRIILKVRRAGHAPSLPSWVCVHSPMIASPPHDALPRSGSCLPTDRVLDCPLERHYLRDGLELLPMHRWPTTSAPHEGTMNPPHFWPMGREHAPSYFHSLT